MTKQFGEGGPEPDRTPPQNKDPRQICPRAIDNFFGGNGLGNNDALEGAFAPQISIVHHTASFSRVRIRFTLETLDGEELVRAFAFDLLHPDSPEHVRSFDSKQQLIRLQRSEEFWGLINACRSQKLQESFVEHKLSQLLRAVDCCETYSNTDLTLPMGRAIVDADQEECVKTTHFFARDTEEFFSGFSRRSTVISRGSVAFAECVMVDLRGECQIAYINMLSAPNPIPLYSRDGRPLNCKNFTREVDALLAPLSRALFAPIALMEQVVASEVERRVEAARLVSGDAGLPTIEPSHADVFQFLLVRKTNEHSATKVLPVGGIQSTEVANHQKRILPLGSSGALVITADPNSETSLIRVTSDPSVAPAPFHIDYTLQQSFLQSVALAKRISQESAVHLEQALGELRSTCDHYQVHVSSVAELYPRIVRSLLRDLRASAPNSAWVSFGFAAAELPQLSINYNRLAYEVSSGVAPMYSIVSERPLSQFSICQLLIDRECRGVLRFYSRVGGYISCTLPNTGETVIDRGAYIGLLMNSFFTAPESLSEVARSIPKVTRLGIVNCIPALSSRDAPLEALLEGYWNIFPTCSGNEVGRFPMLQKEQVTVVNDQALGLVLPFPNGSVYREMHVVCGEQGIFSLMLVRNTPKGRLTSARVCILGKGGSDSLVHANERIAVQRVLKLLGVLASEDAPHAVHRALNLIFPSGDFVVERFDGTESDIYTDSHESFISRFISTLGSFMKRAVSRVRSW